MEYPFGHQHHRRDENPRPPYPPTQPTYGGAYPHPPSETYPPSASYVQSTTHNYPRPETYPHQPSPAVVTGFHHTSHTQHLESHNQPHPPPSYAQHTSHEVRHEGSHHFTPHMPAFIQGHSHGSKSNTHVADAGFNLGYFANKPTFRVYCKAGGNHYSVAIRHGKVVLTQSDPSDPTQHWYKDEKYSTKVKDEEGYPSFALVNKGTGQAVKQSVAGQPVQLVPFKPDVFDESILWTESKDLGSGFRTIRMVNNIRLCMDAFHGDKDHGGVHDGTTVALYESWKGDNQQWRIVPY